MDVAVPDDEIYVRILYEYPVRRGRIYVIALDDIGVPYAAVAGPCFGKRFSGEGRVAVDGDRRMNVI